MARGMLLLPPRVVRGLGVANIINNGSKHQVKQENKFMKCEEKSLFIKCNHIISRLWRKFITGKTTRTLLRDPKLSRGPHVGDDSWSFFSTSEDLAGDTDDESTHLQACRSQLFTPMAWKLGRALLGR